MSCVIRPMEEKDASQVLEMMCVFYASDAVLSNGSEEIFRTDIEHCLSGSPYVEGYVFEDEGQLQGYAMVARSYSTEFGKPCVWLEDIYVKEQFRGLGIGSRFLELMEETYPDAVLRLEVEEENARAVRVYQKCGFEVIPYMEMKK